jgi:ribonuclease PH
MRVISIERHYIKTSAGSALISFGDTKVICTANLSDRVPAWLRNSEQGWVTAEYAMLPGATSDRTDRAKNSGGRAQEISRLIGRSLRAVTDLRAMGLCQATVDCDVIQADGGTRTAAITGAYVALHDAFRRSVKAGLLQQVPLRSGCAAVSVGVVEGEPLLDLDYHEDSRAGTDMNVVMNGVGEFVEVQGSAEGAAFSRAHLDALLDLASGGIRALHALQEEALGRD